MSEKQETISSVIPKDYCIMGVGVVEEEITAIVINKVRDNLPITLYSSHIRNNTESIDEIIPKVLDIIGTDTVYYANEETEIELLKSKCESMQIPITNKLLNIQEVLKGLGIEVEELTEISDNAKRTIVKELNDHNDAWKVLRKEQKYFIANFLDLKS